MRILLSWQESCIMFIRTKHAVHIQLQIRQRGTSRFLFFVPLKPETINNNNDIDSSHAQNIHSVLKTCDRVLVWTVKASTSLQFLSLIHKCSVNINRVKFHVRCSGSGPLQDWFFKFDPLLSIVLVSTLWGGFQGASKDLFYVCCTVLVMFSLWCGLLPLLSLKTRVVQMRHHILYPLKCKRNICLYGLALVASPSNGVKVLSAYLKSEGFEMRWCRVGTAFMCKLRSGWSFQSIYTIQTILLVICFELWLKRWNKGKWLKWPCFLGCLVS